LGQTVAPGAVADLGRKMKWPCRQAKDGRTVFFLHIPKCAGTSLVEDVLKAQFPPKERIVFYEHGTDALIERLQGMSPRQQGRIRCIAGHFAFGVHRYYHARPSTYVTLLRNPIDRVISHYYQVLRKESHYLHSAVRDGRLGLQEYVESGVSIELDNGQTRILAGIGWGADYGRCPRPMLEQAKENLNRHFAAVGISEGFDEFLLLLHREFGWNTDGCGRRNVAAGRPRLEEIDAAAIQSIEAHNRLDQELYRHATALFKQRISQGAVIRVTNVT
jgi:hypothetical protein